MGRPSAFLHSPGAGVPPTAAMTSLPETTCINSVLFAIINLDEVPHG